MAASVNEKQTKDGVSVESENEKSKDESTQIGSDGDTARPQVQDASEEPPSERPIERVISTEEYSVLSVTQKKVVILTVSLASLFSPMATSIYYPSLTTIAKDLHVTDSQVSITVTLFLVIQGIAPACFAEIADKSGRRPVYIMCYIIFNAANIGLALQNSYTALLILRMLQAAGSSATVALANGVVGDIVTSAERGQYIAYASLAGMLGPTVAPILGGVIAQYAGWHFLFWFQLIFSTAVFVPLILFLPETCRAIVDNGTIPPPFFSRNITDYIRHKNRQKRGLTVNTAKQEEIRKNYHWRSPNPLATLVAVTDLETAIILFSTGLGLGCFYAISTGAASAFSSLYGFDQVQIALMFIPIGIGSVCAALSSGRLIDRNYRRYCKMLGIPVVKNRRQDLANFPIEKARLEVAFPVFFLAGSFLIIYGWILTKKFSLAAPVITLFITGFGLTFTFQVLNVLMVDIYPGKPSIATAANNLFRCEIGAVFTAIIIPLINKIGIRWAYTILALLYMGFAPMLLVIMRKGQVWRKERKAKEDKVKLKKEEKARSR
ncbi:Itaconate transport [Hyphodiscus hymeniophilus]|uniref:Itaconate transport n=1 Tax=Hyphodiscus hymeniophilus TaxID=353542 RepID=A0A9P6VLP9_9HELO|nr:Itaconate transport [Hyphodiscus hymeniophilus]